MSRDNFNNLKQKVAGLGLQMEILDSEWQWYVHILPLLHPTRC